MDVHVDPLGIDLEIEKERRKTPFGNQLLVGLQDRLLEIGRAEIAAVDEEILVGPGLAGRGRTTHIALQLDDRGIGHHLQQVVFHGSPHHVDDAAGQRRRLQEVDRRIVVVEFEAHLRIAERHALELGLDMPGRDIRLLQEPAAGRDVVEEVAHHELRPRRAGYDGLSGELPAVDLGHSAQLVLGLTGAQLHLRDGRNRGERLAAESESIEFVDILRRADLAGGVAVEGQPGVDGRHAAAVVDDLDQVAASLAEVDRHAGGPRVDGILHHLLHHRGRAVDHLSGRDLVGDDFG